MTTSDTTTNPVHADTGPDPGLATALAVYTGGPAPRRRTLWDILEETAATFPRAPAIDDGRSILDYSELLKEVEHLRARLESAKVGQGDRVGVRVASGTADLYVAILAVLSMGAAYVPVDTDDPDDRVDLVFSEAAVCAVIGSGREVTRRLGRPTGAGAGRPRPEDDAWIIFTSGTTGKPKGVAVTHGSAAAFVDAEANLFLRADPIGPGDRVLAGLSVAFDASCEEMWLAWRSGACLVPAPRALMKTGPEACTWLSQRRISVVSTVPTLASMWPADALEGIRLLILGGEACPAELATRLVRPGAEVWNTYGPTEATVVSSAARLAASGPVRIGLPLDGWQLAVLDPCSGEPVSWGEVGELVIGGVGMARYLDAKKDHVKFSPVPALGWNRGYRSGDLVRADRQGLVYVGRIDSQLKIRGYRIEPSEIESVLMKLPGVAQAAVGTHEPQPGIMELVGYYSMHPGSKGLDRRGVRDQLRKQLPAHMVPVHLEQLAKIPTLSSGKVDRKCLPAPSSEWQASLARPGADPANATERALADALAGVLGVERIPVDSHLFNDLGANSLSIAHFCARVRETAELPSVSVKDVYLHPTVRGLAAALSNPVPPVVEATPAGPKVEQPSRTARYVLCGVLQVLVFLAQVFFVAMIVDSGFRWLSPATGLTDAYLRAVAFDTVVFALLCGLPVAAKWALVGRWQQQDISMWSLAYVRFWLVKTLIRTSPLTLFTGSPLYVLYLRALGARIGRRVVILSRTVPVCTDLLSIGDDTVIRADVSFTGYSGRSGRIRTGPVTLGSGVLVGQHAVLAPGVMLGDGAQLGHASALYGGQAVPAGERWHGSPAQRTDVDYGRVQPLPCGPLRPLLFGSLQLAVLLLVFLPLTLLLAMLLLTSFPALEDLGRSEGASLATGDFYRDGLMASTVLFCGSILAGVAVAVTVPRLANQGLVPGRTYRLYGLHHWLHRMIGRLTNVPFYLQLTGDSSYVVHYLRALGYHLPDVEQTGSNFGSSLRHETPYLVSVGRGTQVSDAVAFVNADYSSTSFQLVPVSIGARSFLGNSIAYPSDARVGDNCLIGNKTMIPLDGPVREGVGLLGSPCFEIPRSVERDGRFEHLRTGEQFRRRLAAKNRHNLATMGLFLVVRWFLYFVLTLFAMAAWDLYDRFGLLSFAAATAAAGLFTVIYDIAVERLVVARRRLHPQVCSIYEPYFWRHERYWKLQTADHTLPLLNGTPFKGLAWRLLGVRVGRRLFDDGCAMTERQLVSIGDDCTLNAGSVVQCHSMEDGTFRSDHTTIGARCTLDVGAFVHYGVTIEDDVVIETDSFLMKGSQVARGSRWGGNPARETARGALLASSDQVGLPRLAPDGSAWPPSRTSTWAGASG